MFRIEPLDLFSAQTTVNNGTTSTLISKVLSARPPQTFLNAFGQFIDAAAAFATSTWSIRVNAEPIATYGAIVGQIGDLKDPSGIGPVRLHPGQLVEVLVTNNSGANQIYAVRLQGFYEYTGNEIVFGPRVGGGGFMSGGGSGPGGGSGGFGGGTEGGGDPPVPDPPEV